MLDFACSFSQFPFAPLFCLSCILCIYTIRHALDIWAKKRKKISNCVISKCIFFLVHFHYVLYPMKWAIANKITHRKYKKTHIHLLYTLDSYSIRQRLIELLNGLIIKIISSRIKSLP